MLAARHIRHSPCPSPPAAYRDSTSFTFNQGLKFKAGCSSSKLGIKKFWSDTLILWLVFRNITKTGLGTVCTWGHPAPSLLTMEPRDPASSSLRSPPLRSAPQTGPAAAPATPPGVCSRWEHPVSPDFHYQAPSTIPTFSTHMWYPDLQREAF